MFKKLRVALLLFILASVGLSAWRDQSKVAAWESTLHVAIFPINADRSAATQSYIDGLTKDSFERIEAFIETEAQRHGFDTLRPLAVTLGPVMAAQPQPPPVRASAWDAMVWSLKMRWWTWRHTPDAAIRPDIRIYAMYYDAAEYDRLPHSVGIQKGLFGIAHLFANRRYHGSNQVVIAHELLHTLGASDKYQPGSTLPVYPQGFAEPNRTPRYPQVYAEIMGGRIPISETRADIPHGLADVLIGAETAKEIGWTRE